MVDCFDERLKKAQCCALEYAGKVVNAENHGELTDQMFVNFMLLDGYLCTLERYKKKSLHLHSSTGHMVCRCSLTDEEVNKIFEYISVLCGGCSCNC